MDPKSSPSPLTVLRHAFDTLAAQPAFALEVPASDGVRVVDLQVLANRLPRLDRANSDLVWSMVIDHARAKGPEWTTVATGLALKHLWSVVNRVSRGRPFGSRREEVEAEVITAWIAELRQVDTTRPDIVGRMWAAAYRAGQRWRYAAERDLAQLTGTPVSAAHVDKGRHPEVPLITAVAAGLITPVEAELIAATGSDGTPCGRCPANSECRTARPSAGGATPSGPSSPGFGKKSPPEVSPAGP